MISQAELNCPKNREMNLIFFSFDRFIGYTLRGKEQLPTLLRAAGKRDAREHAVPL